MRIFWLIGGFAAGVIMSRNAAAMDTPVAASVFLGAFMGFAIAWFAGNRNKAEAVATAVSISEANALAISESNAKAAANAAINLVLMNNGQALTGYHMREEILNESLKVIDNATDKSRVVNTDGEKEYAHVRTVAGEPSIHPPV